jgi:hypothetical protein
MDEFVGEGTVGNKNKTDHDLTWLQAATRAPQCPATSHNCDCVSFRIDPSPIVIFVITTNYTFNDTHDSPSSRKPRSAAFHQIGRARTKVAMQQCG